MNTFFVLAAIATSAFAQGINVLQPAAGATIASGAPFVMEIQQENYIQPLQQGTVTIGALSCSEVDCSSPSSWGTGSLLFSGPFNPRFDPSAPQKGMFEDLFLTMAQLPVGPAVINVQHDFFIVSASGPQPIHNNATAFFNVV